LLPNGAEERGSYPTLLSSDYLDRSSPVSGDARDPLQNYLGLVGGDSDLIGVPVALGAIVAFLGVLAAFFFVGPILGVVLLIALVILAIVLVVRVIRANELN
jgi:hypothetical protein